MPGCQRYQAIFPGFPQAPLRTSSSPPPPQLASTSTSQRLCLVTWCVPIPAIKKVTRHRVGTPSPPEAGAGFLTVRAEPSRAEPRTKTHQLRWPTPGHLWFLSSQPVTPPNVVRTISMNRHSSEVHDFAKPWYVQFSASSSSPLYLLSDLKNHTVKLAEDLTSIQQLTDQKKKKMRPLEQEVYRSDVSDSSPNPPPETFAHKRSGGTVGAGYIFFWRDPPKAGRRDADVAFAILNSIVERLPCLSQGMNDRLITPRPPIRGAKFVTIIGAYAPPMTGTDEVSNKFYEDQRAVLATALKRDRLIVLGGFNAHVETEHPAWARVLRPH
ncbi:hypothetical protein SprV_0502008800 [Sparganum proliferum]